MLDIFWFFAVPVGSLLALIVLYYALSHAAAYMRYDLRRRYHQIGMELPQDEFAHDERGCGELIHDEIFGHPS